MQDLISIKSKADIIPINRTHKKSTSDIIQALNKVSPYFPMENTEKKKKYLSQMIYRIDLLKVKKGDIVLELGALDAFQSSVISEMGAQVVTVCSNKAEFLENLDAIPRIAKNQVQVFSQDQIVKAGSLAPFDKMIIAPEVSNIPVEFYGLLSINGDMVITSDPTDNPTILHVKRTGETSFDTKKKTGLVDRSASYDVFDL